MAKGRTAQSDLAIFRRLLLQARSHWPHVAVILLLGLLATPLALLTPLPLKIAIDSVVGSEPLPRLLQPLAPRALVSSRAGILVLAAALMVVLALLQQLRTLGDSLLRNYTGAKLVLEFRARLFSHAQRLSLCYHDQAGTTDSTYRIQYDAPSIQWVTMNGIIPFLTAGFTLAGMLWVIVELDPALALVALLVSPLLVILTRIYRARLRHGWTEVKELEHSAFSVIHEAISALRVVKAFGQEEREEKRYLDWHAKGLSAHLGVVFAEGWFELLVGLVTAGGTAAVLYLGVRHVLDGTLSLGDLLVVMAYIGQLYVPLRTLGTNLLTLQGSLASAQRAFELLDQSPRVTERPNAIPLETATGRVEFVNVSFEYERTPVLHDVSFLATAGSRVGIAGRTGAGKTTLVSLLTRFYDPSAGSILLDGVDLRDYRIADLRNQFSIVLQETVLFSTSVAQNIAYARPDAGTAEIVAAAKAANIHDFLAGLPEGYDTLVGERGMMLSGGERQRIALARAFLKNAPILVLDEPTSSVDIGTEAVIMDAMRRLMRGRTTFLIAHRLATLEDCDLILLMDDGRLTIVDGVSDLQRHALSGAVQ